MGLAVNPNPHHTLGALYGKILRTLQKMPEQSVYRKYTEQIVKERAAILQQVIRLKYIVLNIIKYLYLSLSLQSTNYIFLLRLT